jgi:hypothetical protein
VLCLQPSRVPSDGGTAQRVRGQPQSGYEAPIQPIRRAGAATRRSMKARNFRR